MTKQGLFKNAVNSDLTAPAGYVYLCANGLTMNFAVPTNLAYGANGKFFYKNNVTGTITFDNATFGDPAPYADKAGFAQTSLTDADKLILPKVVDPKLGSTPPVTPLGTPPANAPATKLGLYIGIGVGVIALIGGIVLYKKYKKK